MIIDLIADNEGGRRDDARNVSTEIGLVPRGKSRETFCYYSPIVMQFFMAKC